MRNPMVYVLWCICATFVLIYNCPWPPLSFLICFLKTNNWMLYCNCQKNLLYFHLAQVFIYLSSMLISADLPSLTQTSHLCLSAERSRFKELSLMLRAKLDSCNIVEVARLVDIRMSASLFVCLFALIDRIWMFQHL